MASASDTENPLAHTKDNPLYRATLPGSPRCPHKFDKRNAWLHKNFMDYTKFTSSSTGRMNPSCWDCFPAIDKSELIIKKSIRSGGSSDWLHPVAYCPDLNFPEMRHVPWAKSSYGLGNQPKPVMAKGREYPRTPISQTVNNMCGWKLDPKKVDNIRCGGQKIGLCWYQYEHSPKGIYLPKYDKDAPIHKYERADVPTSKFEHRVEVAPKKPESRKWKDICDKFSMLTMVKRETVEYEFDKKGNKYAEECIKYLPRVGVRVDDAKQDYENNIDEYNYYDQYDELYFDNAGGLPLIQGKYNEILSVMLLSTIICLFACIVGYLLGVLSGCVGEKILSKNKYNAKTQYEYGNVNDGSGNEDNEL